MSRFIVAKLLCSPFLLSHDQCTLPTLVQGRTQYHQQIAEENVESKFTNWHDAPLPHMSSHKTLEERAQLEIEPLASKDKHTYPASSPAGTIDHTKNFRIILEGSHEHRIFMLTLLSELTGVEVTASRIRGEYLVNLPSGDTTKRRFGYQLVDHILAAKPMTDMHVSGAMQPHTDTLRLVVATEDHRRDIRVEHLTAGNDIRYCETRQNFTQWGEMLLPIQVNEGHSRIKSISQDYEVWLNPDAKSRTIEGRYYPPVAMLAHELGHVLLALQGDKRHHDRFNTKEELDQDPFAGGAGLWAENEVRKEQGLPIREEYSSEYLRQRRKETGTSNNSKESMQR